MNLHGLNDDYDNAGDELVGERDRGVDEPALVRVLPDHVRRDAQAADHGDGTSGTEKRRNHQQFKGGVRTVAGAQRDPRANSQTDGGSHEVDQTVADVSVGVLEDNGRHER